MAFFTDLRHFKLCFTYYKPVERMCFMKDDTIGRNVFGEFTETDFPAGFCREFIHAFPRQQAHLPVPVAGMGVVSDSQFI
jgi:hypothetical protein